MGFENDCAWNGFSTAYIGTWVLVKDEEFNLFQLVESDSSDPDSHQFDNTAEGIVELNAKLAELFSEELTGAAAPVYTGGVF